MPTTSLIVALHTDRFGSVWHTIGGRPTDSGVGVGKFFADQRYCTAIASADEVRVAGAIGNAGLIVSLYGALGGDRLTLAAPGPLGATNHRCDPVLVLSTLYRPEAVQRCGHLWHRMGQGDVVSYQIAVAIEAAGRVDGKALRLLRSHPAWPAFSFVGPADEEAACRLVAAIIDPRWYADPHRPDRLSKLYSWLGVSPQHMQMGGDGTGQRHANHSVAVVDSWFTVPSAQGRSARSVRDGNHFLHRLARPFDAAGFARASRKFVQLITFVWLDAVHCCPDGGFLPERLLGREVGGAFRQAARNAV